MWQFLPGKRRLSAAASIPASAHTATGPTAWAPAVGSRWRGAVSTLVVFALLAAIALWGHANDWTLPKFSTLIGNKSTPDAAWCPTHNVREADCIECNADLVAPAKNYGWCQEHGLAQCVLEHPDLAQLSATPVITGKDLDQARRALELRPRAENNSRCPSYERRIQFASPAAMEKAGIEVTVAVRRPVVETVVANGELVYDQTHIAHLASRVTGTVWRVERQVGDWVQKGDVLALVDAAEVGRTKGELLQATAQLRLRQANVKRLAGLAGDGTVAARAVREEEAALQEAQIRLLSAQQTLVNLGLPIQAEELLNLSTDEMATQIQHLGLPSEIIAVLDTAATTSNLFPLCAPLDGVVTHCQVVPGEVVDTSATLFQVADPRSMWLMLDVRQEDARYVALNQRVLFRASDSRTDPEMEGRLRWISTSADSQTRTVKVRAELPNAAGQLRANTFGTGRIVLREEPEAIVVPSQAVHSDGDCSVVFVRDKNFFQPDARKFFHVRQVRTGVQTGDTIEIIAGVLPGEVLAEKNSVILAAQLLKSNLGAGCGCAEEH